MTQLEGDTEVKSTLAEISVEMTKYLYAFLHAHMPRIFVTPKQVIFNPVIDEPSDFAMLEEKSGKVALPFAAISRETNITNGMGGSIPSVNHLRYPHRMPAQPGALRMDTWHLIPVQLSYHIRVYAATYDDLELLTQQIIIGMARSQRYEFKSNILSSPANDFIQSMSIIFDEHPVLATLPSRDDRQTGRGTVYVLNFNPKVSTSIGYRDDHAVIRQILTSFKDADTQEIYREIERQVNDSI